MRTARFSGSEGLTPPPRVARFILVLADLGESLL